jgi:hypothetical protein
MHLIRYVRVLVPLLTLGLVGCVLGCSSGMEGGPPPDKETSKKIAADRKAAMQEFAKAKRAQMQGR